jgi:hypothetical protein
MNREDFGWHRAAFMKAFDNLMITYDFKTL